MLPKGDILINKPAIDWLTLTTWSATRYAYWQASFSEVGDWLGPNDSKFEQYKGIKKTFSPGTIFMGEGSQGAGCHYLMYATSRLAHMLYVDASQNVNQEDADTTNCSRIDLQVTIERPKNYDAWELGTALRRRGHLISSPASRSKLNPVELRTIYIGKWEGDKLIRIYEKEDKEGVVFLRFELRLQNDKKGGKAWAAWKSILRDDSRIGGILLDSVQLLNSQRVLEWFGPALSGYMPHRVKTSYSKSMSTRKWLESQVMPALDRYLRETDDTELIVKFYNILAGDIQDEEV
jgi:hypothetical protein